MDNFQQIDPRYMAMLQAGLGILAANNGRQPAGAAIGQGLLGGTNAYQQNLLQQQEAALRQQQMDMQKEQFGWQKDKYTDEKTLADNKRKWLAGIGTPNSLETTSTQLPDTYQNAPQGQTAPNFNMEKIPGQTVTTQTPAFDQSKFYLDAVKNGILDVKDYLTLTTKDNTPIKVGAGDILLDPVSHKPIYTAPPKEDNLPSAIQEYNFAKGQGFNGSFVDFQLAQKRAGASNVSVNNKLDLKTGEGLAKEVGPMVAASKAAAEGANNTLDITKRIDTAITSGKLIAGPLAGGRVKLLQIGEVMGLNGADSSQTLANTRDTIQGLAKITLEGRSALKGQGQISDYEGKLLARASSGDISELTLPELRIISAAARRVAKAQQNIHSKNMKVMRSKPELSDVADFYDVQSNDAPMQPATKAKTADELIKQRGW